MVWRQVLGAISRCGAATSVCVDRAAGAALVHFEQAAAASAAVRELRRVAAHASAAATSPDEQRLCVDYASRECQVSGPHPPLPLAKDPHLFVPTKLQLGKRVETVFSGLAQPYSRL